MKFDTKTVVTVAIIIAILYALWYTSKPINLNGKWMLSHPKMPEKFLIDIVM
jgi:hypothetical protein